jgi:ribosomal-protein-alanine N-acetyltransferase
VRDATAEDLLLLQSIPSAADFFVHRLLVGFHGESLAAYLAWRALAPGEAEILYLFTLGPFRRLGFARSLLNLLKKQGAGILFLEVRESNTPARKLYETEGFNQIGLRRNYYSDPPEDAIVMKFHSC